MKAFNDKHLVEYLESRVDMLECALRDAEILAAFTIRELERELKSANETINMLRDNEEFQDMEDGQCQTSCRGTQTFGNTPSPSTAERSLRDSLKESTIELRPSTLHVSFGSKPQ